MTDCNSCGRCCDPVVISYRQDLVRASLPDPKGEKGLFPEDRRWILEDLTPIPRREGKAMVEYMDSKTVYHHLSPLTGKVIDETVVLSRYYECRHFDKETRQCQNFDNRPPLCRGFPWYGETPEDTKSLPPECSFNADVGREVAKMPVRFLAGRPVH